jgi:desampylase
VTLADGVREAIIDHARQTAPEECCGLLVGTAAKIIDCVAAANIAEAPTRRYLVDPRDHLQAIRSARGRGLEVIGAYHSHPAGRAIPSATDCSAGFADFLFVIVGLALEPPELLAWAWSNGNFTSVPLVRVREG